MANTNTNVPDDMATLEAMVDRVGLVQVLDLLSSVCAEKADHVRSAWQDKALANAWARCEYHCAKASAAVDGEGIVQPT